MPEGWRSGLKRREEDFKVTLTLVAISMFGLLLTVAFFESPHILPAIVHFVIDLAIRFGFIVYSKCSFQAGFICSYNSLATDGSLSLGLGQSSGHPIRLDGMACVPAGTTPSSFTPVNVPIGNGQISAVSGQGAPVVVHCGTGGDAGVSSSWDIWLRYTETDTWLNRTGFGTMIANYE